MSNNKRVLVVDDSMVNRKLASAFLVKLGYVPEAVDCGQAALDYLAANPPVNLILLDISMPGITGEEVCASLRKDARFVNLPIIAYTAHAMTHDVDRFLANGFDAVLLKPNSLQDMEKAIAVAVAKH